MARDQLIKALVRQGCLSEPQLERASLQLADRGSHPVRDPMWLGRADSGAIGPNSTTPGQALRLPNMSSSLAKMSQHVPSPTHLDLDPSIEAVGKHG
jgi:hypothetical protein